MAFTLDLGASAPDFSLPGVDDRGYALSDFDDTPVLVVAFTCNHCPYVVGSEDRINAFYEEYAPQGVALVCINSNDTSNHPNDSFDHMKERAAQKGFGFPYLRDESQDVALAYGALRTPHFYVFDADRRLCYTGRMDDNPMDSAKATTHELTDAVDALLAGQEVPEPMTNPIGCNVKWKNKEEHWMPPEACDLV